MADIDSTGVLAVANDNALCIAAILPLSKAQISNALYDLGDKLEPYKKRLGVLFNCPDIDFIPYTTFEYNDKYMIYARSLAEELEIDEFSEVVEQIKQKF